MCVCVFWGFFGKKMQRELSNQIQLGETLNPLNGFQQFCQ